MAATSIRLGIIGGGWPGVKLAEACAAAGGFKLVAVADPIADRRNALVNASGSTDGRQYESADGCIADVGVDAVALCTPTGLHADHVLAALKAGKHVLCEPPPAPTVQAAKRIESAVKRSGKTLLYASQRRFGGAEQAALQAIAKGYAGTPYHVRASWTRTRGVPAGTGWYADPARSGGGALLDLGFAMLELAWSLLGRATPQSVYCVTHKRFPAIVNGDVEDSAVAIVKFAGGATIDLLTSWAINQPPNQVGTACRLYGDGGAVELYTPRGPQLYTGFDAAARQKSGPTPMPKETPLKLPKTVGHAALLRHFRQCITGEAPAAISASDGVTLMKIFEAAYRSAAGGKSADIRL